MSVSENRKDTQVALKDDYRLQSLTESVKLNKGKLLDIGCGGGIVTESLPNNFPNVQIYGCDVSTRAIEYAKRFDSGKVEYSVIKNKRLPYRDNFFDVCICLDVLEHVPDIVFFLNEIKRILKKGGQLFLAVPCEAQPFTFTWIFQKIKLGQRLTFKHWGHIHPEFTHTHICYLLKKHDFSIEEKTYDGHMLYQLEILFLRFLPKAILSIFLGEKAVKYFDRGVVEAKLSGNTKNDPVMIVRNGWLSLMSLARIVIIWESQLFKTISFGSWRLQILARK